MTHPNGLPSHSVLGLIALQKRLTTEIRRTSRRAHG